MSMTEPGPKKGPLGASPEWIRQLAMALDLPFLLLGAVMGGGIVGYFLDSWLHTGPWLMLLIGLVGFIAGMRALLKSLGQRSGTR